jgi:hypothetical protein
MRNKRGQEFSTFKKDWPNLGKMNKNNLTKLNYEKLVLFFNKNASFSLFIEVSKR